MGAFEDVGGREYLARVAREDPKTFCQLIGRVLPAELKLDPDTAQHLLEIIDFTGQGKHREQHVIDVTDAGDTIVELH